MCVITAYGAQCLVAGCRGSGAGQQAMRPGRGMWHDDSRTTSLLLKSYCLNSCPILFLSIQICCNWKYYETKDWNTKLHMKISADEQAYNIKLPEGDDYIYIQA